MTTEFYKDGLAIDIFKKDCNKNICIFFVHGGGFRNGTRTQWYPVCEYFADKGYICTTIQYHLAPEVQYPVQLGEIESAYDYVKNNICENIVPFGSSAGGYFAIYLSKKSPKAIMAACPLIDTTTRSWSAWLGGELEELPEKYREADLFYKPPVQCPILIMHGDKDSTIPLERSIEYIKKTPNGTIEVLKDVGHGYGYGVETDAQKKMINYIENFLANLK